MTEEEKKAIEYFKNCLNDEYNFKNATRKKDKECYEIILNLIQKQESEINKLKEKLDITKTNYEILQGEMDRIGIDTLHLEAGSSTDDVIDEINKLNNVIQNISDEFLRYDWKNSTNEQIYNQLKNLYESIFMKEE